MQKLLVVAGCLLILIGIALPWIQRTGIGHLPGDIYLKRGTLSLYFPITTCVVLSIIASVLLRLLNK